MLSISKAARVSTNPALDLVALDDALRDLAAIKPQHSRLVELRFFGGLTIEVTAEVLGVSHATVERDWSFARSWLRREMSK
jgi:RNA polymerase sigma-70 factor, ECF subfamily